MPALLPESKNISNLPLSLFACTRTRGLWIIIHLNSARASTKSVQSAFSENVFYDFMGRVKKLISLLRRIEKSCLNVGLVMDQLHGKSLCQRFSHPKTLHFH